MESRKIPLPFFTPTQSNIFIHILVHGETKGDHQSLEEFGEVKVGRVMARHTIGPNVDDPDMDGTGIEEDQEIIVAEIEQDQEKNMTGIGEDQHNIVTGKEEDKEMNRTGMEQDQEWNVTGIEVDLEMNGTGIESTHPQGGTCHQETGDHIHPEETEVGCCLHMMIVIRGISLNPGKSYFIKLLGNLLIFHTRC